MTSSTMSSGSFILVDSRLLGTPPAGPVTTLSFVVVNSRLFGETGVVDADSDRLLLTVAFTVVSIMVLVGGSG